MKDNVIYFEEVKRDKAKRVIKEKFNSVKEFVVRNKETIIFFAPTVIGFATVCVKAGSKRIKLSKEKDLKELYCYDRSLGHYWRLKRELSNSEWVEIDKRKRNGERLADILDELKVLK